MGAVEQQDSYALEILVAAWVEWDELEAVLRKHGRTYETVTDSGSVIVRPRPEMAMAEKARRYVLSMMAEFGLTPSSRTKVKGGSRTETDPLAEFLARK